MALSWNEIKDRALKFINQFQYLGEYYYRKNTFDREIEALVYELYGLNEAEIIIADED